MKLADLQPILVGVLLPLCWCKAAPLLIQLLVVIECVAVPLDPPSSLHEIHGTGGQQLPPPHALQVNDVEVPHEAAAWHGLCVVELPCRKAVHADACGGGCCTICSACWQLL